MVLKDTPLESRLACGHPYLGTNSAQPPSRAPRSNPDLLGWDPGWGSLEGTLFPSPHADMVPCSPPAVWGWLPGHVAPLGKAVPLRRLPLRVAA